MNAESGKGDDSGNITMTGGIAVAATTTVKVGTFVQASLSGAESNAHLAGDVAAAGRLELLAGQSEFRNGDIDIIGEVAVDAAATLDTGDGLGPSTRVFAFSLGIIDAANDVTLTPTDPTVSSDVRATAITKTTGLSARSGAAMVIEAGERSVEELVEDFESAGDASIKGNVFTHVGATATGDFGDDVQELAVAATEITAHAEHDDETGAVIDGGNVTVEFFADENDDGTPETAHVLGGVGHTGEPHATAIAGGRSPSHANAEQSDLDATVAADTDGSPFTFADAALDGVNGNASPISGEIELPSDFGIERLFDLIDVFDIPFANFPFDGAFSATVVHFHDAGVIFPMPGVAAGGLSLEPFLFVRPNPEADGTPTAPAEAAAAPGLLPGGGATCSLGLGNLAIGSDGQVLFSQFFADQTALEFGRNGCEEVVTYPPEADGTASQ